VWVVLIQLPGPAYSVKIKQLDLSETFLYFDLSFQSLLPPHVFLWPSAFLAIAEAFWHRSTRAKHGSLVAASDHQAQSAQMKDRMLDDREITHDALRPGRSRSIYIISLFRTPLFLVTRIQVYPFKDPLLRLASPHPGGLLHEFPIVAMNISLLPAERGSQHSRAYMYVCSMEFRISLYETTRQLCSSRATSIIFSSRLASV